MSAPDALRWLLRWGGKHRNVKSTAFERRRSTRHQLRLEVRYWNDQSEAVGHTINLSANGAYIELPPTSEVPPEGTRYHLEFLLPDEPYFCESEVIRRTAGDEADSGAKVMGVRFLGLFEVLRRATAGTAGAGKPLEVDLKDPWRLASVFKDQITQGGLFLEGEYHVVLNQQVVVKLLLPDPLDPLETQARVVQVFGSGIGLHFEDPAIVRAKVGEIVAPS